MYVKANSVGKLSLYLSREDTMPRPSKPRTKCKIIDCFNYAKAHGLCSRHYQRFLKYGSPREDIRNQAPRLGQSCTPIYKIWKAMIQRCYNNNCGEYHNYGARGITVCDRWKNDFFNFKNDMGERPKGLSLERKDNNGNYSPTNCIWATSKQQSANKRARKDALIVTHNGQTKHLKEFCLDYNLKFMTVFMRLRRGWSLEDALS